MPEFMAFRSWTVRPQLLAKLSHLSPLDGLVVKLQSTARRDRARAEATAGTSPATRSWGKCMVTGMGESFLTRMCATRRDFFDMCFVYIPLQSELGLDRWTSRLAAGTTHDSGVRWRPAFPTGSRIVEAVEDATDGWVAVGDGWCFRSSWRLNAD